MSFWISPLGQEVSGTPESSFVAGFSIIPDGTKVLASIKKFEFINRDDFQFHQITWVILDGQFKGEQVRQKIHTMDQDPNKRHRALNMMMLIYKMFDASPSADGIPDAELAMFHGKIAGIVIREWQNNGKEGNWVSEVHKAAGFEQKTGIKAKKEVSTGDVNAMLDDIGLIY